MTTRTAWLAGTSFYDMGKFLEMPEFPKGIPLVLEREPRNRYDPNAILVFLEAEVATAFHYPAAAIDQKRFKLGHIPAKDGTAAWLAPLMDAGKKATARFERHGPATGIQIVIEVAE
jgi:hypothetical protein